MICPKCFEDAERLANTADYGALCPACVKKLRASVLDDPKPAVDKQITPYHIVEVGAVGFVGQASFKEFDKYQAKVFSMLQAGWRIVDVVRDNFAYAVTIMFKEVAI